MNKIVIDEDYNVVDEAVLEGAVENQKDIDVAISLVDKMVNLSREKQRMLKDYVGEAAHGSDLALAYVLVFPCGRENRDILCDILRLILKGNPNE